MNGLTPARYVCDRCTKKYKVKKVICITPVCKRCCGLCRVEPIMEDTPLGLLEVGPKENVLNGIANRAAARAFMGPRITRAKDVENVIID